MWVDLKICGLVSKSAAGCDTLIALAESDFLFYLYYFSASVVAEHYVGEIGFFLGDTVPEVRVWRVVLVGGFCRAFVGISKRIASLHFCR